MFLNKFYREKLTERVEGAAPSPQCDQHLLLLEIIATQATVKVTHACKYTTDIYQCGIIRPQKHDNLKFKVIKIRESNIQRNLI